MKQYDPFEPLDEEEAYWMMLCESELLCPVSSEEEARIMEAVRRNPKNPGPDPVS